MADIPTGGMDWDAALSGAASSAGKPLEATPQAFASFYGPYADKVAAQTGIDSNTILGQWGLETGWGKSVIPGTNNLGNIKSTKASGQGVSATDNQTGSHDSYQKFGSLDDFANAYTQLLKGRYKGALNTADDATATANALKAGGYAEDKDYAGKVVNAAQQVAKLRGGTNWDALLGGGGQTQRTSLTGLPSMDELNQQYQKQAPDTGSMLGGLAGGVGEGFGKTMLGAQALVGKGLQAIGADQLGQAAIDDAQQGNQRLTQQANDAAGTHSVARTIGNVVGAAAPALAVGPEVLPQMAVGAGYGAGDAALNNKDILTNSIEGAGMGAGGAVAGKLLGAGVQALGPAMRDVTATLKGGDAAATQGIANAIGKDELGNVIGNLRANADSPIPGVQRTAAEAANNPGIIKVQRQLQNTEQGQSAFPARAAANTEARFDAGRAVVGSDIDAEAQAFTQQQAARIAAGQAELPPINDAQAAAMQTPAYAEAITKAKKAAGNAGVSAFDDQQAAIQRGLAGEIDNVAGTPASLDAAKAARRAQATNDYGNISGLIPTSVDGFGDLRARPGVLDAIRDATRLNDTRLGNAAPDGFIRQGGERQLQMGPNGELNWVDGPQREFIDAQTLSTAKSILGDRAVSLGQAGNRTEADAYSKAAQAVHDFLSERNAAYRTANSNYAAASPAIDAQESLLKRLNGAVDPVSGEVNPNKLRSAINSIQGEQLKPGMRPADRVSDAQLNQLANLSEQARQAGTNTAGLPGQGQEFLRQALEENATQSVGKLKGEDAARAAEAFKQYLAENSPSYRKYFSVDSGYGADLRSRQALSDALDKVAASANNAHGAPQMAYSSVKSAIRQAGPLSGAAKDFAQNLLDDLQQSTTANVSLGAAGSQTAANLNLGGGLLGKMLGSHIGSHAITAELARGNVVGAALGAVAKKAFGAAQVKSEKAAIELLLNPKKLADELERYKNQPNARKAFVEGLKHKASGAGAAGARAVNAYNAANS